MSLSIALGQLGIGISGVAAGWLYKEYGYLSNALLGALALVLMALVVGYGLPEPDLQASVGKDSLQPALLPIPGDGLLNPFFEADLLAVAEVAAGFVHRAHLAGVADFAGFFAVERRVGAVRRPASSTSAPIGSTRNGGMCTISARRPRAFSVASRISRQE